MEVVNLHAERFTASLLRINATRAAMLRKGIRPDVARREVRSLEMAIRTKLWAIVMQGDGVA
jgi:hypothetical protein